MHIQMHQAIGASCHTNAASLFELDKLSVHFSGIYLPMASR
jgi:hypothetical protein